MQKRLLSFSTYTCFLYFCKKLLWNVLSYCFEEKRFFKIHRNRISRLFENPNEQAIHPSNTENIPLYCLESAVFYKITRFGCRLSSISVQLEVAWPQYSLIVHIKSFNQSISLSNQLVLLSSQLLQVCPVPLIEIPVQ